ncbi:uncharacterized protein LOC132310267 [Cornus florida]|uniref:uncharacterized protein LOC132310267 n=1 Tax=Cornus florida TaxID=4283 RepID=UPI00289AA474|nr:uncharacterized protein LOC132310267 [Cornus florida]
MTSGLRLCWCLFLAFAIICSAPYTVSLSGDEMMVVSKEGRSLEVKLDDYNEASANERHDPRNRASASSGSAGGRKSRNP